VSKDRQHFLALFYKAIIQNSLYHRYFFP